MSFSSKCVRACAVVLGQSLLAALTLADAATAGKSTPTVSTRVPASPLNLILGILFLLALIAAAWWLLRRANGLQWPAQRAAMKVVASLPVGTRERVVLVEIAGQQWLLGVATGQVTLLHRFEEPVIASAGGDEFAQRMRQILHNSIGRS